MGRTTTSRARAQQAQLFECDLFFCCTPVDLSGARAYTHLIKGPDDPERSERPKGGRADKSPHRTNLATTTEEWAARIEALMADGRARTFNAICVEMVDQEASIAFQGPIDGALWYLVGRARLAHTMTAPIYFRLVEDDCG